MGFSYMRFGSLGRISSIMVIPMDEKEKTDYPLWLKLLALLWMLFAYGAYYHVNLFK